MPLNIEKELKVIKQVLKKEYANHPALTSTEIEIPDLLVSHLFLEIVSSSNPNKSREIENTAVALELLNSAVNRHYFDRSLLTEKSNNAYVIDVISGDYFYSRALLKVSKLNDPLIVNILAGAIAEVSEAISRILDLNTFADINLEEIYMMGLKLGAIYGAAGKLGFYIGKLPENARSLTEKLASSLGAIYYSKTLINRHLSKKYLDKLVNKYENNISKISATLRDFGVELNPERYVRFQ